MVKMHFDEKRGHCEITIEGRRIDVLSEFTTVTAQAFKQILKTVPADEFDEYYNTFMKVFSFAIYEEVEEDE